MATLNELHQVLSNSVPGADVLLNKIVAAVVIAAETIRTESPATANHANRLIWAKEAFQNSRNKANEMFPALLASNAAVTQTQMLNATDTAIQNNVDSAVDVFATGVV